jgi:choice-of-anchor A domain-containing protein
LAIVWAAQISFNLLPGADVNTSLVVINVAGAVDGSFNLTNAVINLNGLPAANLIWNVCDAGAVGFTNIQFRGSLLAPFSTLSLGYVLVCRVCRVVCCSLIAMFMCRNVQVEGSIVAATLAGSSFEQIEAPFSGFFCPA